MALTRILDTTAIDANDQQIMAELEIDLRRMDRLKHEGMPRGSKVYHVKVLPSITTYRPGLHRFGFEMRYGIIVKGEFKQKGKKVLYQTETLPMT